MRRPTRTTAPLALAALLVLPGCLGISLPRPLGVETGRAYTSGPTAPVLLTNAAWWRAMDDPVLDTLVAEALDANLSLAAARARRDAARAAVDTIGSGATVTGRADGQLSRGGSARVGVTATLDWLLDPWGGRRARLRAALAEADAAEAERAAAELAVLLEVSTGYVELRHQQRVAALRRDSRARRQDTLALFNRLKQAGEATRLDPLRIRSQIAEIDAELPGLDATVTARRADLAALTGRSAAHAAPLPPRGQPVPGLAPDLGIPADLLRNRPDIRAAELAYAAAVARIDAARAALYPTLSLGGTIGLDLSDGRVGRQALFGPALTLPALPRGPVRAELARRHALATAAHAEWQALVVDAIAEVETALAAWRAAGATRQAAARSVRLSREALGATEELIEAGLITLTDLVTVEDQLSNAERGLADANRDVALQFVILNVRLGAGHATSGTPPLDK